MGRKRGRAEGSFVAETRRQVTDFYRDLVQGLVLPRTKAPKIREEQRADEQKSNEAPMLEKTEGEARREREHSLQRLAEVMPFTPQ